MLGVVWEEVRPSLPSLPTGKPKADAAAGVRDGEGSWWRHGGRKEEGARPL